MFKKYLNKTIKNPTQVIKEGDRIIIEKFMGKKVGSHGEKYIRVIIDKKSGEVITAYPVKSMKTIVPGAHIGTTLFGTGIIGTLIDFVNPLSDIEDVINLF